MAKKTKKRSFVRLVVLFWLLVVSGIGLFSLLMYSAANAWFGFDPLPSFTELENPKSNLASEVFTSDGKVLGQYFIQNRVNVKYEDLSPHLTTALVATEDERYYEHSGIDLRGLIRAIIGMGKKGGASTITQQLAKMLFHEREGTILNRIRQKLQEWIIAARLERNYTKEEIIAMYLNRFDFINNAVGIKSAASVYFGKSAKDLNMQESAMLVGMLKNPALFNPIRRVDTTLHRREVVLFQMRKNGAINSTEYDSLRQLPLGLQYTRVDHKDGNAPYFREILRSELRRILQEKDPNTDEYLHLKPNGEPYNLYKDGLKIYTTINSKMQAYAEWAVQKYLSEKLQDDFFRDLSKRRSPPFSSDLTKKQVKGILNAAKRRSQRYSIMTGKQCANCGRRGKFIEEKEIEGKTFFVCNAYDCGHEHPATPTDSIDVIFNRPTPMRVFSWKGEIDTVMSPMDSIRYYKSFLQAGFMSMDPHTGYIKAWVGGINHKHFSYDHVKQGKRQVGSTFKPFVYAVAIDEKLSPCKIVPNTPTTFYKGEWGLLKDWTPQNTDPSDIGYNVSLKYGLSQSMNTITAWVMKQFGPPRVIKMARDLGITSPLDTVPSLALGVADVSVYEMVGAFSTFANKGLYTQPIFLTRIEDKDGNIIVEYAPNTNEVMDEETAYVMLDLLKGVTSYNFNEDLQKNKGGSGIRIRFAQHKYGGLQVPIAGKTGTTQNNSDGWFIGATPDLVSGAWVGAEDRSVRFRRTYDGQGANTALPIWGYYMNKVYADSTLDISQEDFEKPEKPISIELDCNKGGNVGFGFDDNAGDDIFSQ